MSIKVGGPNGSLTIDQGTEIDLTITTEQLKPLTMSWDGIPYVDPDAIGANATAKIYPDGSILGSTDNGSYTKWPNGALECSFLEATGSNTATTPNGSSFFGFPTIPPYPIVFVALPYLIVDTISLSSVSWGTSNAGTVSQSVCVVVGSNAAAVSRAGYVAKGRWK